MDAPFNIDLEGLQAVLAAIPDFVLVVDRDGVIRYINRVEEGYEIERVIGQPSHAALHPDSWAAFDAALDHTFRTGGAEPFDSAVILPAGERAWYRSRMFPLLRDGHTVAVLVFATNVTELRAAQEEIDRMRRLLPICAWCDRIQREDGVWESIEAHLKRETGTDVSHGLCPVCFARQMEGLPSDGTGA